MKKLFITRAFSCLMVLVVLVSCLIECVPAFADDLNFIDLSSDHWAHSDVEWAVENGYMSGYPDKTFKPDAPLTRAELAKIITNVLGYELITPDTPFFVDVKNGKHWAFSYVETCKPLFKYSKESKGYYFRPSNNITREEVAFAMVNATNKQDQDIELEVLNVFTDSQSISANYKKYVAIAVSNEFMKGCGNSTFKPKKSLTRAEAVVLFHNILTKANGKLDIIQPAISTNPTPMPTEIPLQTSAPTPTSASASTSAPTPPQTPPPTSSQTPPPTSSQTPPPTSSQTLMPSSSPLQVYLNENKLSWDKSNLNWYVVKAIPSGKEDMYTGWINLYNCKSEACNKNVGTATNYINLKDILSQKEMASGTYRILASAIQAEQNETNVFDKVSSDDFNICKSVKYEYISPTGLIDSVKSDKTEGITLQSEGVITLQSEGVNNLKIGDTVSISLQSTPGTGSPWECTNNVPELKLLSKTKTSTERLGEPIEYTWKFIAIAEGESTLTFGFNRSWEKENPEVTREFKIKVINPDAITLQSESIITLQSEGVNNLKIGDTVSISLQSTPGTGSSWNYTNVPELKFLSKTFAATDSSQKVTIGGPIEYTWKFIAIAEGESTLTFKFYRSWEKENSEVTENFKIKVTKAS